MLHAMMIWQLVGPTLWSQLKYLCNYARDFHDIRCIYSWCREDEPPDFSCRQLKVLVILLK